MGRSKKGFNRKKQEVLSSVELLSKEELVIEVKFLRLRNNALKTALNLLLDRISGKSKDCV